MWQDPCPIKVLPRSVVMWKVKTTATILIPHVALSVGLSLSSLANPCIGVVCLKQAHETIADFVFQSDLARAGVIMPDREGTESEVTCEGREVRGGVRRSNHLNKGLGYLKRT